MSCSRGKTGIKIYTDSVAELRRAVVRSDEHLSAADLLAIFPTPQHPVRPPQPAKDSKRRDSRAQRIKRAVTACLFGCVQRLQTAVENGVAVIASLKRPALRTGLEQGRPVITTEDQTRSVETVLEQGNQVCGARRPAEHVPSQAPGKSAPLTSDTGASHPIPVVPSSAQPPVAPPLHPQPDSRSQSLSI